MENGSAYVAYNLLENKRTDACPGSAARKDENSELLTGVWTRWAGRVDSLTAATSKEGTLHVTLERYILGH